MKRLLLVLAAIAAFSFAFAQTTVDMSDQTIAEILNNAEQVSILNVMVEFAGLDSTLATEGPFTVFAPVDRAWVGVNAETISDLIGQPDTLRSVLLYHVVSGQVDSDRLFTLLLEDAGQRIGDDTALGMEVDEPVDALEEAEADPEQAPLDDQQIGDDATTNLGVEDPVEALLSTGVTSAVTFDSVEGSTLEVTAGPASSTVGDGGQRIGEGDELMGIAAPVAALRTDGFDLLVNSSANIVSVDIIASNGVIHLIDAVLVPESVQLGN